MAIKNLWGSNPASTLIKFVIGSLLLTSVSLNSNAEISKHQQIMAGFLLHLTSFTQWPALEHDHITLCLLTPDPFNSYVNKMVQRRPRNSQGKLIVLNYSHAEGMNLSQCQIIYLPPEHYPTLWQNISPEQNILLVSQSKTFIEQGGMINFVQQDKRIQLEVNLPAVTAAQLKISSELLKHAKIVNVKPRK